MSWKIDILLREVHSDKDRCSLANAGQSGHQIQLFICKMQHYKILMCCRGTPSSMV